MNVNIDQIIASVQAGWVFSVSLLGTGLTTFLGMIPTDIGVLASLMGMVGICVTIYIQLDQRKRNKESENLRNEKLRLEIQKLKKE